MVYCLLNIKSSHQSSVTNPVPQVRVASVNHAAFDSEWSTAKLDRASIASQWKCCFCKNLKKVQPFMRQHKHQPNCGYEATATRQKVLFQSTFVPNGNKQNQLFIRITKAHWNPLPRVATAFLCELVIILFENNQSRECPTMPITDLFSMGLHKCSNV